MKYLSIFLNQCPSYVKCGDEKIANATGISINTVKKFKKTKEFKKLNQNYRAGLLG